jgi:tRNA(Ile2)-agmatinylcytidine synthase
MIPRRHVFFSIEDDSGQVECAAYEPTSALRKIAMKLMVGDYVEVYGGVRKPSGDIPLTLNLEKIRLSKLAPKIAYQNPICPRCGKRLKSMGKQKGLRCDKCGSRYPRAEKIQVRLKRDVKRGLYITSTRSQRHLTKPYGRYGMEKHHVKMKELMENWHFP